MKFRAFIACEIHPSKEMIDIFNVLRNSQADLKLVEQNNIHLTLKFLGDIEEAFVPKIEDIIRACIDETNIRLQTVKLVGIGAFPTPTRPRVVWVGVYGAEPLVTLAELLDNKLFEIGFEREKRAFTAHITIARVKSSRNIGRLQAVLDAYRDAKFGEQQLSEIKLKKSVLTSKGPIYSDVVSVRFKARSQ